MDGFWSRSKGRDPHASRGHPAGSRGIHRNPAGATLGLVLLVVLGLVPLAPGSADEARGAGGSIQACARVLPLPGTAELVPAKSELREEIQQMLLRQAQPLGPPSRSSTEGQATLDLDGGRVRVRLESAPGSGRLTVEYLAN